MLMYWRIEDGLSIEVLFSLKGQFCAKKTLPRPSKNLILIPEVVTLQLL